MEQKILYLRLEENDDLQLVILAVLQWYYRRIFLLSKMKYVRYGLGKVGLITIWQMGTCLTIC
jgi:hypothetical protein